MLQCSGHSGLRPPSRERKGAGVSRGVRLIQSAGVLALLGWLLVGCAAGRQRTTYRSHRRSPNFRLDDIGFRCAKDAP